MNRAIDARLHKIERALSPDPEDELGLPRMSADDLSRLLHNIAAHIAANEGGLFTTDEVRDARVKLSDLETDVWDQIKFQQRPDIAEAISSNRAAGRKRMPRDRDWEALAREWGLLYAAGNLSPRPQEAQIGAVVH